MTFLAFVIMAVSVIVVATILATVQSRRRGGRIGVERHRTEEAGGMGRKDGAMRRLRALFGAAPAAPAIDVPLPPPPPNLDLSDPRIPPGALGRIHEIDRALAEVSAAMTRESLTQIRSAELDTMRNVHLVKLVRSYLDISPAHRSEVFRSTGKSASFILMEGLDAMKRRIDEVLADLARHDIDAFTQNVRFIGNRYNEADDPFRL